MQFGARKVVSKANAANERTPKAANLGISEINTQLKVLLCSIELPLRVHLGQKAVFL